MSRTDMRLALGLGMVGVLAMAGCSSEHDDIRQWMAEQRAQVKPNVPPITPPKQYIPQPYATAEALEPFSVQKMNVALKREAAQPNSLVAAELNRRRESLESFPLDSMTMVGSMVREGQPYALLKVDKLLYQVRVGNYLGQNFGKITKITETEVALREIVQDAAGEWTERTITLQIQGKSP